jgi:pyrophosphatase PpaX
VALARWRYVLFDLDGTLADSIRLIIESYEHAFRVVSNREIDPRTARTWIGQTLMDTFGREDPPRAKALETEYRAYNEANMAGAIGGYPGVPDVLRALRDAGAVLGVATSKRRAQAEDTMRLAGVGDLAELVVAMEDTAVHKPDPAPLLLACERLGVRDKAECVYVGDAVHDIQAARAAGLEGVAVTWGAGTPADLVAAAPVAVCDTPAELQAVLLPPT